MHWHCRAEVGASLALPTDSKAQAVIFVLALLQPPFKDVELVGAAVVARAVVSSGAEELSSSCCLHGWPPLLTEALATPAVHEAAVRQQQCFAEKWCLLGLLLDLFLAVNQQFSAQEVDEDGVRLTELDRQLGPLLKAARPIAIDLIRDILPLLGDDTFREDGDMDLDFIQALVAFLAFPLGWCFCSDSSKGSGSSSSGSRATNGLSSDRADVVGSDRGVSPSDCKASCGCGSINCSCTDRGPCSRDSYVPGSKPEGGSHPDSGSHGIVPDSRTATGGTGTGPGSTRTCESKPRRCHCGQSDAASAKQQAKTLLPAVVALARHTLACSRRAATAQSEEQAATSCFHLLHAALNFGSVIAMGADCTSPFTCNSCQHTLTDAEVPAVFRVVETICDLTAAVRPMI